MKSAILIFCLFVMVGCKGNQSQFKGEDCNVGIFSKSLNSPQFKFKNDTLTIHSGIESDYFNAPDGVEKKSNAPILLTEIDNNKPFTFTAKVEPDFLTIYDAGAMYIYCHDDLWQKLAFEMDERGITRIVTVRTVNTSDDNNHDAVAQKEVYMKISSDTQIIGFYYSLDGNQWQLVRLYKNEYPSMIIIGLSSQSPTSKSISSQSQSSNIKTIFSEIELSNKSIRNFRLGL